ncbi:glycosyltransferase [Halotalea alkalilenta]|uniref:glycosyltransferase n=1 Tax=Halotalea alkalilenta TaxID=376489 RepID=UPI0009DD8AE7|nr:glycosyltransferase [Halotalea alkalilenta]
MSHLNKLTLIHAFWIGKQLGPIASACLKSFVVHGHRVMLHAYQPISDLPDGVEWCNAESVLSNEKVFQHSASGSFALFSDLFRYELLSRETGVYVDCDVYCVAPIELPDHGYLFGLENDYRLNGAVLAAPRDSVFIAELLRSARDPYLIPEWMSKSRRHKLWLRKRLGFPVRREKMKWGTLGPAAITHFARKLDLIRYAKPVDVLYPIGYDRVSQLLDPGLMLNDLLTSRSCCIHLFNEVLKTHDLSNVPESSPLGRIISSQ